MQKRTELVGKFSSFLQLDDAQDLIDGGWYTVPRLHQNMTRRRECDRTAKEEYWAKLILREALASAPLAKDHLAAYLEEVAYWTVMDIRHKLARYQLRKVDFFQIAREATVQPVTLFHRYDFKSSGVKTFASLTLRDYVADALFKGREWEKFSPTGLLRSLSYLELEKSLKNRGLTADEIRENRLLLKCFKEKYVPTKQPGTRALQPPDSRQLEVIALYYNESRSPSSPPLSATEVRRSLKDFVNWVRSDATVQMVSIDSLSRDLPEKYDSEVAFDPEGGKKEYHSEASFDPEEEADEKDREIDGILSRYFAELPERIRVLFELCYGLDINQGDLWQCMGFKGQPELSKFLKRTNKELLKKFSAWAKENWEIALSHEEIDRLVKVLKIWLNKRCAVRFQRILQNTLLETYPEELGMLAAVATARGKVSQREIQARLKEIKTALQDTLKSEVERLCSRPADEMRSVHKKVVNFVEIYLQQAPYAEFYSAAPGEWGMGNGEWGMGNG